MARVRFGVSPRTTALVSALALVLSACSESAVLPSETSVFRPTFSSIPTPAQVIVPIGDPGSFTNAIVANNSGRALTEFWDAFSADNASTSNCNVGFWATGLMAADCLNETAGSDAGQGGFATYFGDGSGARDAAGFMFKGGREYTVTLKGAYHGSPSEVGWFTVSGGVYTLHPIPEWSISTLDHFEVITSAADWGFYIKNGFNPATGGCVGADTHCSDATGGFTSTPNQQFALMLNAAQTRYLVGAEDNRLELLPNGAFRDSDYNDYIWWVDPSPVSEPQEEVCDFITFGRLVTTVNGKKVVISGNAGGNAPGGGILGEFHIDVDGVDNHVSTMATYGPIVSGPLAGLPNARMVTGTAKNGNAVELRLWDGGEPGKGTDRVYVTINGVAVLGAVGPFIDQGNMQYHPNCRGPK